MTTPTLELHIRASGVAEVNALRQGLAGLRSEADKLKALGGSFGALDEAVKQLKELRKEIGKGFSGLEASLRTSMQGAARVAKEGGAATAKAFEEALAKGIRDRQSQNEKMAASVTAINAAATEKARQSGQAVGKAYAEGVEQAASKVRLSASVNLGGGVRASFSQAGLGGYSALLGDLAKTSSFGPAAAASQAKAVAALEKQVEAVMRAALQGPNTMRGKGYIKWWDKAIAEQEQGLAELRARTAAGMVMMDQEVARYRKNQMADLSRTARGSVGAAMGSAGWYSTLGGTERNVPAVPSLPATGDSDGGLSRLSRMSQALGLFTLKANDAHSAARGLASGFGLLWLTWGNMAPLLAGAGISHAFVQMVKSGADVQHTLEVIRVLSQETTTAVEGLNVQLLDIARSGPIGPREVAEAMKTLSLAGLNAGEVSAAIKDVLNFAVAGTTSIQTAADVLTSVATAFKISASNYGYVGDVIAKTAAVSKSSVESIGSAFKTASVINAQYGVSLEDVGVSLALLSNLGIQGTAAGTALRNMYVDLSERTPKVAKALKEVGLQVLDDSGKMRDLAGIVADLDKGLQKFDGRGQTKLLQQIFSERGAKDAIAVLDAYRSKLSDATDETRTKFEQLAREIESAAGFMAISASKLALTPLNQMKSVMSALEASLVENFNNLQPYILQVSANLKQAFGSEEFKTGLQNLGAVVGGLTLALVQNLDVVVALGTAYVALKAVQALIGIYSAFQVRVLGLTGALLGEAAAARAATVAQQGLAAANTAAASATTAAAVASTGAAAAASRWATGLGVALGFVGRLLGPLALIVSLWQAYSFWTERSNAAANIRTNNDNALLDSLRSEAERLKEVNDAKMLGISLDELKARKGAQQMRNAPDLEMAQAESAVAKARANVAKNDPRQLVAAANQRELVAAEEALAGLRMDRLKKARRIEEAEAAVVYESQRMKDSVKADAEKLKGQLVLGNQSYTPPTPGSGGKGSHRLAYDNDAEMLRSQFRTRESELKAGYEAERQVLENAQRNKLVDEGTFQARSLLQLESHEAQVREAVAKSREELTKEYDSRVSAAGLLPTIDDQVNAESNLTAKYRTAMGELDAALTKLSADRSKRIGLMTQNAAGAVLALKTENEEYWAKLAAGVSKESEAAQARAALADASEEVRTRRAAEVKVEEQAAPQIEKLRKEYEKAAEALEKFSSEYGDGATVESLAVYAGLERRLQGIGTAIAYANAELEKVKKSAADGATAELQVKNDERRRKEIRSMADDLNEAFAEALLEGGKTGGQKLQRWLKDLFKQPITLVLKALFQPLANAAASVLSESLGLGGLGGSGEAGGALKSWGIGEVFSKAKDWALGAFGFNTGAASAALAGTNVAAGVAATGDLASSIAAANAASAAGAAGGIMSTVGPALPWVGAGLLVARLFSKKGGGPKVQGYSSNYFVGGDNDLETNKSLQTTMDDLAGRYSTLNRLFGGRGGIGFGMGVSMDPKGDANTFVGARLTKDGQTLQDWTNSNVPRTEAEMQKVIADYTTTQLFIGLVNSGLEKKYQEYFDKVAADLQPGDEGVKAMQAAIELASAVKQLSDQLQPLGGIFTGISNLSMEATKELIDFAGGVQELASSLSSYYQNFYSEEERFAASLASVQRTMAELGYGSVDTLDEFRNLVDGLDLTTSEGRQLFTQLMNVQQAFHDVYDSAARLEKLRGLTDQAMSRLERAVGKEVATYEKRQEVLKDLQDELQGLFDLLKDSIKGLYDEVPSVVSFKAAQGNGFIAQALAAAKLTGSLPNEDELSDAIKDSRKGLDEAVFASQADADYARLVLAGRLSELKDIVGFQLTDAQKQLKATEDQLVYLEQLLESSRDQLAAMREGDYTIAQALSMLAATLAAERAVTPGGAAGPVNVVEGLYNGLLGRRSDPEGFAYWSNRLASGESISSITAAMQASAEYVNMMNGGLTSAQSAALLGVPALATGTNYVPQDMFAFLHKGESVVPAQYNPSSGIDPVLRATLEKLTSELEGLKDAQRVANSHAYRTAEAVNGRPESPVLVEVVS